MAETTQEETTVGKKLFEIYEEALNLSESIDKSALPCNGAEYQQTVKKCIALFEDATKLVSLIGMFSSNEFVEEIPTENLQFLLLPFFLGQLVQKLQCSEREATLEVSRVYFKDFLKRCEEYEIIAEEKQLNVQNSDNQQSNNEMEILLIAANQRNSKIAQFRKMKELEEQISALKLAANNPNVDDEIKRKLYTQQINHSALKAKEELLSIDQEIKMLEYRKSMIGNSSESKNSKTNVPHRNHQYTYKPPVPLKPIIITKDVAQKAVFGLGYPSLPVMTVDEFYEQRVAEGIFPSQEKSKQINKTMLNKQSGEESEAKEEIDRAQQDELEDRDDEENIARLRARDEYKDVVRRGDGNRHNRS